MDERDQKWLDAVNKYADDVIVLKKQNANLLAALQRLVLAFDVGDMCHTTVNGRGYRALIDARQAIASAEGG
jgi:hypothetical protein